MEKGLAEASVLANPGSRCDPEKAEGDMSISKQSCNVTGMSEKDELLTGLQPENDDDQMTTNMRKHDDNRVTSSVATFMEKPAQTKHPGAIPKKRRREESNVQRTPTLLVTVSDLEENVGSHEELTSKPIHVETKEQRSHAPPNRNCSAPWSLPPPERDKRSEEMFDPHNQSFTVVTTASEEENGLILAQNRMSNKLASDSYMSSAGSSFLKGSEAICEQNETPHIENINHISVTAGQDSITQSDHQSGIPPQPPSPEEGSHHSSRDATSLVTGRSLLTTSVAVVPCGSSTENLNSRQSRNPAEHDDVIRNDGLLFQLEKENETLRLNETYLVEENRILNQKWRKQSLENEDLRQHLEASRAENAKQLEQNGELQDEIGQLRDSLQEREITIAENLEMIHKSQEMLQWKSQECDGLTESRDSLRETVRTLKMVIDQLVCRDPPPFMEEEENESDYLEQPGSALSDTLQEPEAAGVGLRINDLFELPGDDDPPDGSLC